MPCRLEQEFLCYKYLLKRWNTNSPIKSCHLQWEKELGCYIMHIQLHACETWTINRQAEKHPLAAVMWFPWKCSQRMSRKDRKKNETVNPSWNNIISYQEIIKVTQKAISLTGISVCLHQNYRCLKYSLYWYYFLNVTWVTILWKFTVMIHTWASCIGSKCQQLWSLFLIVKVKFPI